MCIKFYLKLTVVEIYRNRWTKNYTQHTEIKGFNCHCSLSERNRTELFTINFYFKRLLNLKESNYLENVNRLPLITLLIGSFSLFSPPFLPLTESSTVTTYKYESFSFSFGKMHKEFLLFTCIALYFYLIEHTIPMITLIYIDTWIL